MGPRTDSSCCCQVCNLSWAPVPPSSCCCQGPVCVMGPCTASIVLLSPSPHSAMCHFQVSSHCWWVPFFHRVLYGLPLLLPPPPHCGSTLWFWPVTAQMSEVCGDSKIDRAIICMSY
ncbi:unnamed protein product [Staurois parvus]|uniref:Uncharacterized protein n=1 Tax=Staurois parvus TaxID=386267 RepID=A0ABN9AP10_9NEOB|nr:unnamed protein product [Staurois parvus]